MKKIIVSFVLIVFLLGSCSFKQKIVGTWRDEENNAWVFGSSDKLKYENGSPNSIKEYKYSITDNEMTIYLGEGLFGGEDIQKYNISISSDGKKIFLRGGKKIIGWSDAGPGMPENQLIKW